jgi:hypothetical protein
MITSNQFKMKFAKILDQCEQTRRECKKKDDKKEASMAP